MKSPTQFLHLAVGLFAILFASGLPNLVHAQLTSQETVFYVHTDALGNPILETDSEGNVVWEVDYRAYGEEVIGPPRDGPAFTGHYRDAATGLIYMQQRYYDPAAGRFLSVDPAGVNPTTGENFNRYWYANNNPYKFIDPDGRAAICAVPGPMQVCVSAVVAAVKAVVYVGSAVTVAKVSNAVYNEAGSESTNDGANASIDDARDRVTGGSEPDRVTSKGTRIYGDSPMGESANDVMGDIRTLPGAKTGTRISGRGPVTVVTLPDGSRVIDRNSKQGDRTIEIQDDKGRKTDEVRYPKDELKR